MPHGSTLALSLPPSPTWTRRAVLGLGATALATGLMPMVPHVARAIPAMHEPFELIAAQAMPIRWAGSLPGDGFHIRHGFATENTWYNPGWWHTGEDWYALDDAETGGAEVVSVAPGVVVFVGSDYPGRVVIVQHKPFLYSMYGHLDPAVRVAETTVVEAGQTLGTVLARTDGAAPSHLHFEIRTFLFEDQVNGASPIYDVSCGPNCAPGPGYWPMDAAAHPTELGWLSPLEEMLGWRVGSAPFEVAVSASGDARAVDLLAEVGGATIGTLDLVAGETFTVTAVQTNDPAGIGSSAEAYGVWFQLAVNDLVGWISPIATSAADTGSDGRPTGIELLLIPTTYPIESTNATSATATG